MSDRCAVVMTLNGEIVDWKVFDEQHQAYEHYNEGVSRLREMLRNPSSEGDWEIMLCDVRQYALSKPHREKTCEVHEEVDWYTKYLTVMANHAKRVTALRPKWSLDMWTKLRKGVTSTLSRTEEEKTHQTGL